MGVGTVLKNPIFYYFEINRSNFNVTVKLEIVKNVIVFTYFY